MLVSYHLFHMCVRVCVFQNSSQFLNMFFKGFSRFTDRGICTE
uniref:Uncharacterized protein n=1 Tax=Arundo donax TaxID=35708 RepID=A0A0A8ZEZ7_ARUDO